jgi:hypothetical protein
MKRLFFLVGLLGLLGCVEDSVPLPVALLVDNSRYNLAVVNVGTKPIKSIEMEINSDYEWKFVGLGVGDTLPLRAADFTNDDGTKFNWLTTKIKRFSVCGKFAGSDDWSCYVEYYE